MQTIQSRRRFLAASAGAGVASFLGARKSLAAMPPPETTTVRLANAAPAICVAPQYVAGELLRAEGFTDVRYVAVGATDQSIARGDVDFGGLFSADYIMAIDAGEPITMLAGMHSGCVELFGNERVHSITDLKDKRVGVLAIGSSTHAFISVMASYVGLDPAKDIHWVTSPWLKPMELFVEGKIDAFLGFPPETQELRARKIGHVIVNTGIDHPWSEYFCCMLAGNPGYIQRYPVATKRVLRAILKAVDLCVSDPLSVAERLVDRGFTPRYDYAVEALKMVPYGTWREYDPEDTVRFFALRLRELGMIKSSPQKIISENTNWSYLNELKRELKG